METICQRLQDWTKQQPDKMLFRFLDKKGKEQEAYTYAAFSGRSDKLASYLQQVVGIKSGERVLLVYQPGLEIAVAFFACAKLGAIPVPVAPPNLASSNVSLDNLAHIIGDAQASHILTSSYFLDHLQRRSQSHQGVANWLKHPAIASMVWTETDTIQGRGHFDLQPKGQILFLQYTSGSTQRPRGVVVRHDNVIHNSHVGLTHDNPVGVSWLPHYHDMGLIGYFLFSMLRGGGSVFFSPLDFLRNPGLWFEAITRYRGTVTSAPNFAFDYCLQEDKLPSELCAQYDLSSVRQMVNAAEPVRSQTYQKFFEKFAGCGLSKQAHMVAYGLAEHTLCVTTEGRTLLTRSGSHGRSAGAFVSCGTPCDDIDVRIVDAQTKQEVPTGEEGEIWVHSPSQTEGYFRRDDTNRETFAAHLKADPEKKPYLRTGDMGFIETGELYISGRLKDMFIVRGENIYPNDIEAFVEQLHPTLGVANTVAFGIADSASDGDKLVLLIEAKPNSKTPPPIDKIAEQIQSQLVVPVHVVATVRKGSIARTSSGKIARRQSQARWRDGTIDVIATTGREATAITPLKEKSKPATELDRLLEKVRGRMEQVADKDATLEAIGLDSIELVSLSLEIEDLIQSAGHETGKLTALLSDMRVFQTLTWSQLSHLVTTLRQPRSSGEQEDQWQALLQTASRRIAQQEQEQMQQDARFRRVIEPAAKKETNSQRGVFLTGATGFLGSFLARSLLEQTKEPLFLLVRCRDQNHGHARILEALQSTGLSRSEVEHALSSRITLLQGTLEKPQFALSDAEWQRLARETGSIYHCGAIVDYVKSYSALRAANALAINEIAALATHTHQKVIHMISTTFVFGWSVTGRLLEKQTNRWMNGLDFGYAQSKWVAEKILREAGKNGLAVKYYRPSLVTASQGGAYGPDDITVRVLGYMIRHGISINSNNQISFLPVDICANNIVSIARNDAIKADTFHLTADDYYTMEDVCRIITSEYGHHFRYTDINGFIDHLNTHCDPDDSLFPLRSFFVRNAPHFITMQGKRYDSRNYRRARERTESCKDHPDLTSTVRLIVDYLHREGLHESRSERLLRAI